MPASVPHCDIAILPDGRMTPADAAAYVGVKEGTLAQWRCKGIGPRFVKFGRLFYFQVDLDDWIRRASGVQSTEEGRMRMAQQYLSDEATVQAS
jgi:hypothetical protein